MDYKRFKHQHTVEEFIDAAGSGNMDELRRVKEQMDRESIDIDSYFGNINALQKALKNRHQEAIKFLIDQGADLMLEGANPLHFVAYHGLYGLIDDYANDINVVNSRGSSPLMVALESLHCAKYNSMVIDEEKIIHYRTCCDALLAKDGIDVNVQNNMGLTPLHWAVDADEKGLVRTLMSRGANIVKDKEGRCVMDMAHDEMKAILEANVTLEVQEVLSGIVDQVVDVQPLSCNQRVI